MPPKSEISNQSITNRIAYLTKVVNRTQLFTRVSTKLLVLIRHFLIQLAARLAIEIPRRTTEQSLARTDSKWTALLANFSKTAFALCFSCSFCSATMARDKTVHNYNTQCTFEVSIPIGAIELLPRFVQLLGELRILLQLHLFLSQRDFIVPLS